jgi:hypothetical protein
MGRERSAPFCVSVSLKTHTDKKENENFLIYTEIQMGSVIYEEGLPNI